MGIFEGMASSLRDKGGRLYLAEVSEEIRRQLKRTGTLEEIGEENIISAGDRLLASLHQVYREANKWLEMSSLGDDNK